MAEHRTLELLLRRYVDAVWTQRNPDAADGFLHPDYRRHVGPTRAPLTRNQQKDLLRAFQSGFPDARLTVDQVLVDGDTVVFRSTFRGTHKGVFRGIAPTGRRVQVGLLDLIRVDEGLFAEQWGGPDLHDLLSQIGCRVTAPPSNQPGSTV